jgi:hypothetical protein
MTRAVHCSSCGETVREMTSAYLSAYTELDGQDDTCPECDAYGVFQFDADEDGVRVTFQAEEHDGSPLCPCGTCPDGGPFPCIDYERSSCPWHRDPSYCGTCNYCEQSED